MKRWKNPFRGVCTSPDRHSKLRHRLAIAGARVPAAYNTLTGDLGAARSAFDV